MVDKVEQHDNASEETEVSRRNLMLGAIAAGAGGVALDATDASAHPHKKPKPMFHVAFEERPNLELVQKSLAEILEIAGCTNCGFNGFDLRFGLARNVQGIKEYREIGNGVRFQKIRG